MPNYMALGEGLYIMCVGEGVCVCVCMCVCVFVWIVSFSATVSVLKVIKVKI